MCNMTNYSDVNSSILILFKKKETQPKNMLLSSSSSSSSSSSLLPYQDEVGKVYNGDCREILQTISFDYIITDPPYNVNYNYVDFNDKMKPDEYVDLLSVLKPYKSVLIHYTESFIGPIRDAIGIPQKTVSWCYNTPLHRQHRTLGWFNCRPDFSKVKQPYKNPNDKRIKEHVDKNGSTGARLYDWWHDIPVVKNISKEKIPGFTNQIPTALLERIILLTTNENDTIVDPFFGTGSLYFACRNTNRKCIGIEQSSDHLNYFKQRIERGY